MTDAPERIWIAPWREGDWSEGDWDDNEGKTLNDKPCIEYVRANRIEALTKERDHWSDVAGREGVCMSCRGPNGAPEPYGCTDCLNTGYCGEHHNTVADLEAKLAKAVRLIDMAVELARWDLNPKLRDDMMNFTADLKGESHE